MFSGPNFRWFRQYGILCLAFIPLIWILNERPDSSLHAYMLMFRIEPMVVAQCDFKGLFPCEWGPPVTTSLQSLKAHNFLTVHAADVRLAIMERGGIGLSFRRKN
jgi:hypothetical protein